MSQFFTEYYLRLPCGHSPEITFAKLSEQQSF